MTPVAYDSTTHRPDATVSPPFTCPECPGTLRDVGQSLRCSDCGHVPRHGAD
ncbi:hypothetical protein ACKVMT_04315 [Halobacteriales archaeon Cl-PHB]